MVHQEPARSWVRKKTQWWKLLDFCNSSLCVWICTRNKNK